MLKINPYQSPIEKPPTRGVDFSVEDAKMNKAKMFTEWKMAIFGVFFVYSILTLGILLFSYAY